MTQQMEILPGVETKVDETNIKSLGPMTDRDTNSRSYKLKQLKSGLDKIAKERNQVSVADMKRYSVLFRKSGHEEVDSYHTLCKEWIDRIDPYRAVEVITHYGKGAEVLFKLPPMWRHTATLNEAAPEDLSYIDALRNAIAKNNFLRPDQLRAMHGILNIYTAAESKQEVRNTEEFKDFQKIMDDFNKRVVSGDDIDDDEFTTKKVVVSNEPDVADEDYGWT